MEIFLEGMGRFRDQLSSGIRSVEALNNAVKGGAALREYSANLAMIGGGALAASAAIALPLKSAVEGYEDLQDHMARLGAALGTATDKSKQLGAAEEFVKKEAVATGYSTIELTESLYQGISGFLKMDEAMAVSTQAAKVARATQGDLAETTNTLATMMLNFSDKLKSPAENAQILSDKLTAIQTQGKWSTITDLQYALKDSAPVMNAFGVSLNQGLGALSAFSAAGLDSSNAGTAFMEIMGQLSKASGKLGFKEVYNSDGGVDLLATVEQIKQKFAGMSRGDFGKMMVEGFGLRAGPRMVDLIDKMDQFKQATDIAANSAGATDRAFSEFQKRGTLAFSRLQQAVDVLKDDLGGALAPAVEGVTRHLLKFAERIEPIAAAHPKITKVIADFAALTAAVLGTLGAVALLGASMSFIKSYSGVLKLVSAYKAWRTATDSVALAHFGLNTEMAATRFGSLMAGVRAAGVAFLGYASAVWSAVSASVAFLFTNPVGWVILGVAALAAFGWALYHYRDAIWAWTKWVGTEFTKLGTAAYDWGANLLTNFASGIANGAGKAIHAIENLAGRMARFVRGHSPIPEGPLRNLNMGAELARTIQPAPIIAAMRRVAMVTAVAAPMMIGAAAASAGTGATTGAAPIVINYTVNISGAAAADSSSLERVLERHGSKLVDIMNRELSKRGRRDF
jgi:TP901 family phage tail tape measure protein